MYYYYYYYYLYYYYSVCINNSHAVHLCSRLTSITFTRGMPSERRKKTSGRPDLVHRHSQTVKLHRLPGCHCTYSFLMNIIHITFREARALLVSCCKVLNTKKTKCIDAILEEADINDNTYQKKERKLEKKK